MKKNKLILNNLLTTQAFYGDCKEAEFFLEEKKRSIRDVILEEIPKKQYHSGNEQSVNWTDNGRNKALDEVTEIINKLFS